MSLTMWRFTSGFAVEGKVFTINVTVSFDSLMSYIVFYSYKGMFITGLISLIKHCIIFRGTNILNDNAGE